ncbi:MAG: hypothetical protein PHR68_02745 [Candidatus Gracilibacteria bacterium]|nr:hypothetical protein [Candidatus Gracilibacteria bacterium]
MIYLFTGNSSYLIERKVKAWKKAFLEKFGDFNVLHLRDLSVISQNFLQENLLSGPFLGDKKLIILEDFFKKGKSKKDDESIGDEEDENETNMNEFFLENLGKIPENNIVVLTSTNILKTSKIYKFIREFGKIEEFDIKDNYDLKNNLEKIYTDLVDSRALDLIISYKAGDIYKIINEIDKLLIINDKISYEIVEKYVIPEMEQNIFPIIDDFLNLKKKDFFEKLDIILQRNNYFQFYWSFLSNLRFYVYVFKLKSDGYSNHKILADLNLGNRGFLLEKNFKVSIQNLFSTYEKLVNLDLKMKSGDFVGSNESDLVFEFDKVLLEYFGQN